MADSTVVATFYSYPNGNDNTMRRQILRGTVAIGASPGTYTAGGYALNNVFAQEQVKSSDYNAPASLKFYSVSGSGYTYVWIRSTNKLMVLTGSAAQSPSAQLSNGNTPAGVSGDTIEFELAVPRNA